MRKLATIVSVLALFGLAAPPVYADSIGLYEVGFNVNGNTYSTVPGGPITNSLPAGGINTSAFDFVTGLGTISLTLNTPGAQSVLGFLDLEITGLTNPFNDEYGEVAGSAPAGLTWEIDEPGFVFGDIYDNVYVNGVLDGLNSVPLATPDDPAMALAWNFVLNPGEVAVLSWISSDVAPVGFHLVHHDSQSGIAAYYRSTLEIRQATVPEPGTLLLVATGLAAGYRGWRRRVRAS